MTYNGNTVGGGSVTFEPAEGAGRYSSSIDKDGNYAIREVPAGEMIVTVETESIKAAAKKKVAYGTKEHKKGGDPMSMIEKTPSMTYGSIM